MDFYTTYKQFIGNAPKKAFRKQIVELCQIEPATFYSWLHNKKVPRLAQKVISEHFNKSIEDFFPTKEIKT